VRGGGVRPALALLAVAFSILPAVGRAAERADIDLKVAAGLADRFRAGWVPVTVRIEASSSFDGELVVETAPNDSNLDRRRARCRVSVRRGAPAEYTLYLHLRPLTGGRGEIHAYLNRRGRPVTRRYRTTLTPLAPDEVFVCTISQKPGILGTAATPRPTGGYRARSEKRYVVTADLAWEARKGVPADVPDRWIGYASADVVVLYEADFSKMHAGEARAKALYEWVKGGGTVVLAASDRRWFDRPFVRSLLPSRPGAAGAAPAILAELERFGGAEFRRRESIATCARAAPSPGGANKILPHALWSVESGLGRAIFLGVDLANPDVKTWAAHRALWRKLVGTGDLVPRRPATDRGGFLVESYGALKTARDALDMSRERLPTVYVMLCLVLAYLVLVGPLNYVLLKRLKLRPLLVATIPTVALAFVALNFIVGYSAHGFGTAGRRTSLTVALPGTNLVRTTTCVSFLPAAKTTADLGGDRYSAPEPIEGESAAEAAGMTLGRRALVKTVERDGRLILDEVPLSMWGMVFYRSESVRPLGGAQGGAPPLELRRVAKDRFVLRNRTEGLRLREAVSVDASGRVVERIGDVPPGASRTIEIPKNGPRLPAGLSETWRHAGGRGKFLAGAGKLMSALTWARSPGWLVWPHRRGLQGTAAVVARIDAPLEELRLGGRAPKDGGLDLIVIPAGAGDAR